MREGLTLGNIRDASGDAKVRIRSASEVGSNVAGIGLLHLPGSFNTDLRSGCGDRTEIGNRGEVVGGFFSRLLIMSVVSTGGESSVSRLTTQKLQKCIESFSVKLLEAPEESVGVSVSNVPVIWRWVELARDSVVCVVSLSPMQY